MLDSSAFDLGFVFFLKSWTSLEFTEDYLQKVHVIDILPWLQHIIHHLQVW